ncbi:hypothetical protein G4B88_011436 [Cannabis sativa]|uniref:Alpha/beta hydrolase fold-3 domain-containing protein n=1 Tax=Cannabis sativa TaxID=3483 RepID=A0A7J6GHU0_CANSA|nr:hypothetical protein G4B88_011436 [Cannabis sativa]
MSSIINPIQTLQFSTSLHFFSSTPSSSSSSSLPKLRLKPSTTTTKLFCISSTPDAMAAPTTDEVARDFFPFLRIYKSGRIERIAGADVVPPSIDPKTGVESKDVVISPETGVKARLYVPNSSVAGQSQSPKKLPLVVYFHGGGFCVETPFCAKYHNAVNTLVAEANVVAVSVDYRLAPENPIPIAYDDSWDAVKWVVSHSEGTGPEEWLNSRADHERVFFAGDSAGANIAHHMAIRVGLEGGLSNGSKLLGIALIHPYFWGAEPIGNEVKFPEKGKWAEGIWRFVSPTTTGVDDPYINPGKDSNLGKLGCERVLICVAENDLLRDRGLYYKEILEKSDWVGRVEVVEAAGDEHVFHLTKPTCENAVAMLKKISSFVEQS